MVDSNSNVVAVMKDHGIRKIVVMQALGVGDSLSNLPLAVRWLFKYSNMSAQFEDHNAVDQEVRISGLDYVLARPARLEEGESMPLKFFGNHGRGIGMMASISRKSVATFLVDAAEKSDWNKSTPVIAN